MTGGETRRNDSTKRARLSLSLSLSSRYYRSSEGANRYKSKRITRNKMTIVKNNERRRG